MYLYMWVSVILLWVNRCFVIHGLVPKILRFSKIYSPNLTVFAIKNKTNQVCYLPHTFWIHFLILLALCQMSKEWKTSLKSSATKKESFHKLSSRNDRNPIISDFQSTWTQTDKNTCNLFPMSFLIEEEASVQTSTTLTTFFSLSKAFFKAFFSMVLDFIPTWRLSRTSTSRIYSNTTSIRK